MVVCQLCHGYLGDAVPMAAVRVVILRLLVTAGTEATQRTVLDIQVWHWVAKLDDHFPSQASICLLQLQLL